MSSPNPTTTAPRDLIRAFWMLVLLFNVSLLAITIGILLITFRNQLLLGSFLLILGIAFGAIGYHRYIHYRYEHTFSHETE